MRSLILRLIPLLLATALLCGCTPVPDPTDTDLGGTDTDSAVTDTDLTVFDNGATEYRIVYAADASSVVRSAAASLQAHLKNAYGSKISMVSDKEAPIATEILFGATNRPASEAALSALADQADFSLTLSGQAVVLACATDYAARQAADYVIATFTGGTALTLSALDEYWDARDGKHPLPVSRFEFDEGNGTTATDAVTGKPATLVNASWAEGVSGSALFLDDDATGYLDLGKGYFADLCQGAEGVTLSLWVMAYQNRSSRLFSFFGDGSTTATYCLYRPSSFYFYARSTPEESLKRDLYEYDAGADCLMGTSESKVNDGIWQHLAMVIDYKEGVIRCYLNGSELKGTNGITKGFASQVLKVANPKASDSLGGDSRGNHFSFCGLIDSFAVYDQALSEGEIRRVANGAVDTNSPVVDQALLDRIVTKLRGDYAIAAGSALYCRDGAMHPLDPKDPTLTVTEKDGKWYLPAAFAETVFGDALKSVSPVDGVYELTACCAASGKKLCLQDGVAVISEKVVWSSEDSAFTKRLYRLMTEFSYDLPTTDVESTRVVVADNKKDTTIRHCFSPYIVKIGSSFYLTMDNHKRFTYVFRSDDNGATFTRLSVLSPMAGASLFELNGALYLLGMTGKETTEIGVAKSTDGGVTWSSVTTVPYGVANKYCAPSAVVRANGRIYKAFEGYKTTDWTEDKRTYTVSAPETADLLDPKSWTVSSHYSYEISDLMGQVDEFYTDKTYIQEGCLVKMADGSIRNVLRIDCFPYYGGAVSFAVSPDGKTQSYEKNDPLSHISLPTGGDLFHVEYDAVSGYYISLINIKTTEIRPYQRNVLALAVSKDLDEWTVVENLLVDRSMSNPYVSMCMRGFQYVSFCFDGNDLVFAVREAGENADNYHDNDLLTVYRLSEFRSLFAGR